MICDTVKGNLVTMALQAMYNGEKLWFGHGANCQKAMASGIAKEIAERIPAVKEIDDMAKSELGSYSVYMNNNVAFLNLYTQFLTGANASYDAVYDCFSKLNTHYNTTKYLRWAGAFNDTPDRLLIPYIGCGIGGLKLEPVTALINAATPDLPITFVEYDGSE